MSSSDVPRPAPFTSPWELDELSVPDYTKVWEEVRLPTPMGGIPAIDVEMAQRMVEAEERARREADAYDRGFDEGQQVAREAHNAAIASAMGALGEAADSVGQHTARWVANAEENITALAIAIARHLVQREITADPELVATLVQRAVAQFPMTESVTVRVHPEDLAACERFSGPEHVGATVRLVADTSVIRGGCLTEGRERIIDGRIDSALERVYRSLAQVGA